MKPKLDVQHRGDNLNSKQGSSSHGGDGGHGYTQAAHWGGGTYETITLTDGSAVRVVNGDRDCSFSIINALEVIDVDCHGASCTGNMRERLLATGLFRWAPIDNQSYAQRGDIYLNEGCHTAMCTSDEPDMLCQFSISENGTLYGRQGGQIERVGERAGVQGPARGELRHCAGADERYAWMINIRDNRAIFAPCMLYGAKRRQPMEPEAFSVILAIGETADVEFVCVARCARPL